MLSNPFRYTIIVTPSLITSDTAIGDLPIEKRGCQPDTDDYESDIFTEYSFSKCIYECSLKLSGNEMSCLPWDQLLLKIRDQMNICSRWEKASVEFLMKSLGTKMCTHCIPDCNSTTYAYSVTREKLEARMLFYDTAKSF